jgi:hypothetical protein
LGSGTLLDTPLLPVMLILQPEAAVQDDQNTQA